MTTTSFPADTSSQPAAVTTSGTVTVPAPAPLPVTVPAGTHLYIQGDTPNTWMESQDWQRAFLTPLHVSLDSKPSYYFKNRKYEYLAYPLNKNSPCLCPDLSAIHASMNMSTIPYYGGYGWIFGHSVASNPYKTVTPPVGVLVNLRTGVSRYYIFTTSSLTDVSVNHPHPGATKICQKCSDGYKAQKYGGATTPDFTSYH